MYFIHFCFVSFFVGLCKGLPQSSSEQKNCDDFKSQGYSCVDENLCAAVNCTSKDGFEPTFLGPDSAPGVILFSGISENIEKFDCNADSGHVDKLQLKCSAPRAANQIQLVCCHQSARMSAPFIEDKERDPPTKATPTVRLCGVHLPNGFSVRSGIPDEEAKFAEWPHTCALFKSGLFIGGASLITPGLVLTAAHKVINESSSAILIRCGEWDLSTANKVNENEVQDYQEKNVQDIVIHPSFDAVLLSNNIAILQTDGEFEVGKAVVPICLPSASGLDELDRDNCIATGWGRPAPANTTQLYDTLKEVSLTITDQSECIKSLAPNNGKIFKLHESNICASGKSKEKTCSGDGGGPLVCAKKTENETYVQVGITSWGKQCGEEDAPGVYSSIEYNLCFIDQVTKCLANDAYSKYYDYKHCLDWVENEGKKIRSENNSLDNVQFSLKLLDKLETICSDM